VTGDSAACLELVPITIASVLSAFSDNRSDRANDALLGSSQRVLEWYWHPAGDRQVVELQVHAEHDDPEEHESTSTKGLAGVKHDAVESGSRSIQSFDAVQSVLKDM